MSRQCSLPARWRDGVIERRTQHASRPQTAAPAAQHPSSPDARGRGSRRNPSKVRYCSLEPRVCDGRRDAHERRTSDRPARLMKRRKTRARPRAKKMCARFFVIKKIIIKIKKRRLTSRRVRYFRIRESYHFWLLRKTSRDPVIQGWICSLAVRGTVFRSKDLGN